MAEQKRGRGRPKKTELNDPEQIAKKMEEMVKKADASAAANYWKFYKVLEDTALGKNKGSITNQVSCAKQLMERVENFLAEHGEIDEEDESLEDGEIGVPEDMAEELANVISVDFEEDTGT